MASITINGPGMLSIQVLILVLTFIQTVGVIIILLKLNLSLKDIFSLSSPIIRPSEKTPLGYNGE
jgi:hypothetical protein